MGKFSETIFEGSTSTVAPAGKFSSAILGTESRQPAAAPPVQTTVGGDFLRGAGDTALFGFADEAEAGVRSMFGPETFKEELATARAKQEAAGPAFLGGQLAGAFVPGLGIAGTAARGATTAAKLGRAALSGGIAGGVSGFGSGEGGLPGEKGSLTERLPSAAIGAAIGAPLGVVGERVGAGISKFAERRLAKDIDRLDPGKVAGLQQKAQSQGIQLTPAEATNLPSLKAQQKALGNLPQTSDDLADFYAGRAEEQIEPAVNKFLEEFSPISGADVVGFRGRAAAQGAMDGIATNRAEQAAPLYQKAFAEAPSVDTKPVLDHINKQITLFPHTGEVRKQLTKAMNLLMKAEATPTFRHGFQVPASTTVGRLVPELRLENLHSAKMEIDQMIDAADADKKLGPVVRRELTIVRELLKGKMNIASDTYESATNIYSDLVPGVERVREGVTGIIANLSDTNARLAASKLFNPATSTPVLAREAKQLLSKQDPDAWQGLKRAWLEELWLRAGKETLEGGPKVNRGALFRKSVLGDLRQRQILKETLEPNEFKALTDLSEVLEASGRVKSVGSDTAWNQELRRAQQKDASSLLTRSLRLMSPDVLKSIADRWDERRLAQQSQQLVSIITSSDGIKMMRELKRLPARDVFKRSVFAQMMASMITTESTQAAAPLTVDISPAGPMGPEPPGTPQ